MIAQFRRSWALFLASSMVMAGHGLNVSHLGVRASLEGFSSFEAGIVFAVFAIGFLISTRITPILLERVGHVRVYAAYVAGGSVCALLYGEFVNPVFWAIVRLVAGLCLSGMFVVSESWLNALTSNRERGRLLSLYVMTQLLGLLAGQAMLQLAPPETNSLFILSSALFSLSCVPMLLVSSPMPVYRAATRMTVRALYRVSPLGAVGIGLIGVTFSVAYSMGPVFAVAAGFEIGQVALFVAAIYAGGTLCQYPVGWLSDKFDRRFVAMGLSAAAACVSLVAVLLQPGPAVLILLAVVLGATAAPLYALFNAHANDFVEEDSMPSVSAGLMFVHGIGSTLGPATAGVAMSMLGPYGYFAVLLMAALAILGFAIYRSGRRPVAAGGSGGVYAPLPPKPTPAMAEAFLRAARSDARKKEGERGK